MFSFLTCFPFKEKLSMILKPCFSLMWCLHFLSHQIGIAGTDGPGCLVFP